MTDRQALFTFIIRAGHATWASSEGSVDVPERSGFDEYVYSEGTLMYRDSFVGSKRSWGTETVYKNEKPIWNMLYGGGMVNGKENITDSTYEFLKKALKMSEEGFESFRGPRKFDEGDWVYSYDQSGDIESFYGREEIFYQGELVHFYNTLGGLIE